MLTPKASPALGFLILVLFPLAVSADPAAAPLQFSFSSSIPNHTPVAPALGYSKERGYGFDLQAGGENAPHFFSVALPAEGNYHVTVTLGDVVAESITTIKAEQRRLMLENVTVPAGKLESRTFTVSTRRPPIANSDKAVKGGRVDPNDLQWDDRLTLEISGRRPALHALKIARADDAVTVYLAGDSTVTDQDKEPYNSWGQMLPRFFKPGVAVANYARSGASLKSFVGENRLAKVMSTIKPGDYFLIQFGHNDQKDKAPGAGAFTSYKDLLKRLVGEAKQRGAHPVLITPVSRRSFGPEGKIVNNLGDFPEAVRQTAKEEGVPLIDLNAMSRLFYEAMGPEKSKQAFAPGDNTHHNNYGSYQLAKCVVQGIRQAKLPLADQLVAEATPYNPSQPDPIESFAVPPSPASTTTKPEGN